MLCPHLSHSSCWIHACVWPWSCWSAPRAIDISSSLWTCLVIWTHEWPGLLTPGLPCSLIQGWWDRPSPAGSLCYHAGFWLAIALAWQGFFFFLLWLSFFISHLTVGNVIHLCPDNFLGKLLVDELRRIRWAILVKRMLVTDFNWNSYQKNGVKFHM